MVLPELSLVRSDEGTFLTQNTLVGPGETLEDAQSRLEARRMALTAATLPLFDPSPTGHTEIRSARPPSEFEHAVRQATERIAAGDIEKVVLAREVLLQAPAAYDPATIFGALRELFPSCFCFCAGTPEAAFIGASPELLVRRSGAGVSTVALAGSTRRSSDPAVDDHLGEQLLRSAKDRSEHAIVARRIERALRPHSVWVQAEPEPGLAKIANIQHLATPIHAQLAEPRSAVELAGILHPTPAVAASPGRQPKPRSPTSSRWTEAGTPAPSAGWTPPKTASSA